MTPYRAAQIARRVWVNQGTITGAECDELERERQNDKETMVDIALRLCGIPAIDWEKVPYEKRGPMIDGLLAQREVRASHAERTTAKGGRE